MEVGASGPGGRRLSKRQNAKVEKSLIKLDGGAGGTREYTVLYSRTAQKMKSEMRKV